MSQSEKDKSTQIVQFEFIEKDKERIDASPVIDLEYLLNSVFKNKGMIFITTLIAAALFVGVSYLTTTQYTATVLLGESREDSNTLSIASDFGGFGGLIGLSGGNKVVEEYLAILRSREFTKKFIEKENILPILFQPKWDNENEVWLQKTSITDLVFSSKKNDNDNNKPSDWDAYEKFDAIRTAHVSSKSGLIRLNVKWHDPEVAADWANKLIYYLNHHMRNKALEKSLLKLDYLKNLLSETNNTQLTVVLSNGIQSEITNIANINAKTDYAFSILDGAVVPKKKTSPIRILYLVSGIMFGLILNILFIVYKGFGVNRKI